MKKIILIFTTTFFLMACTNNQDQVSSPENTGTMETEHKYTPEMVVNKKDFVCGMPTTAGISDTVHYKENAYGFCSSECKAAFLQDPDTYIASK
ncbi:MAG: YHS domain-containing protein [bacterium]|jgi:YHS domain-containing protein